MLKCLKTYVSQHKEIPNACAATVSSNYGVLIVVNIVSQTHTHTSTDTNTHIILILETCARKVCVTE